MKTNTLSICRMRRQGFFFTLAIALSLLAACTGGNAPDTSSGKLRLLATTGMVRDAVSQVVKDRAEVSALMGAGVDPHLYKATQSDLGKISYANAIFYNGLFLEGKLSDVLEKAARKRYVIPVSDGIDPALLLHADSTATTAAANDSTASHAAYDPHIWFDVSLWSKAVAHISNEMQRIDPPNADFYRQNALSYIAQLEQLHTQIKTDLAAIPAEQRLLITSHDAFHYFGRAYGIEVKGLQGISTVAEFGLKDISQMVDLIVSRRIKAVFIESSVPQKSLEAVVAGCQERGWSVKIGGTLYSDALGADNTPEGTYIGMLQSNVRTIVNGLK